MANPFELRAELLKQATDIMTTQYAANMQAYHDLAKANTKSFEEMIALMPKAPTIDEIITEATKFYDFVNMKK